MIATSPLTTLPEWVASYVKIPFEDRGRTRAGLDCWGLATVVYRDVFGVALPLYDASYDSVRDRVAVPRLFFEEATSARWRQVPLAEARMPDILSMRLAINSHVGIMLTPERFLHVAHGRETCVERLRPLWIHRVEAVYRHEAFA